MRNFWSIGPKVNRLTSGQIVPKGKKITCGHYVHKLHAITLGQVDQKLKIDIFIDFRTNVLYNILRVDGGSLFAESSSSDYIETLWESDGKEDSSYANNC